MDFPLIEYSENKGPQDWGTSHGEGFRGPIQELAGIRGELLRHWNPSFQEDWISAESQRQWQSTKNFDKDIFDELEGIRRGADLSVEEIVILNNYTDFRDRNPSEGCSTVFWRGSDEVFAGQTWDMHGSATDFVCVIRAQGVLLLSVVGSVGLMGFNRSGLAVGVNNLNTKDAKPGILWPALVRRLLRSESLTEMRRVAREAPVTSGHNYMLASHEKCEMWEITPTKKELCPARGETFDFHTNHALTTSVSEVEVKAQMSVTTKGRYQILEKKMPQMKNSSELLSVMRSHEGAPSSICVHTPGGLRHDSATCGGGLGDLLKGEVIFWKGCALDSKTFREKRLLVNK